MKILTVIKRVVDYRVNIRVKDDQTGVELNNVKMSMNPFDEIAVEEAIRLKEQNIASEVVVLCIGVTKAEEIIRQALAMGADRGILLTTEQDIEPLAEAKAIAKIIGEESPNLVITGKQSIDDDMNQTGQCLAGIMGWGQATFASKITIASDKTNADVTREVDGGLKTINVKLPAVITTDLRLNEPRYVKLPDIMKARSKPLDKRELNSLGVDTTARLSLVKVEAPAKRQAGIKVETVDELIEKLKEKQVI